MNDESLKSLLERADGDPSPVVGSVRVFADGIRERYRRRRQGRACAAALAIAIIGVGIVGFRDKNQPIQIASAIVDDRQATTKRLRERREQIDHNERLIASLLAAERLSDLEETAKLHPTPDDSQWILEEQLGRTAITLLQCADLQAASPEGEATAKRQYVAVIEQFPRTVWAERAQQRLARFKP